MSVRPPLRDALARPRDRRLAVRVSLAVLALVVLVMPALDLGWNEPKLAGHPGVPCPLHANPVVDVRPTGESLNLRGAYLEVLGDALGSIGVIVAAAVIRMTGSTRRSTALTTSAGLAPDRCSLRAQSSSCNQRGKPRDEARQR